MRSGKCGASSVGAAQGTASEHSRHGDPLQDISILTKPEENLALIMKDGRIYKNTIQ